MNIRCFQRRLSAVAPSSFPTPMASLQPPSRSETHFWYVIPDEINCTSLLNRYMEILTPCEKENVLTMAGDQLQKRALLARALVRTTIARYQTNCFVDPRSLKFRKNRYGKPELELQSDDDIQLRKIQFNISHTSSLIACGVTTNSPIGIDVEEKQRKTKNNMLAFVKRYFSPHEFKRLSSISDFEAQSQEFIKLWTLKEAYVKALGKGFSAAPFKTFTIRLSGGVKGCFELTEGLDSEASEIRVESLDDSKNLTSNWQFVLAELEGSHYAAICNVPLRLTAWKTIPFVEDKCASGTDAIVTIGGMVKHNVVA
ncbi:hypothetical protein K2173_018592 [Erythroxylum novogranatense]|uniref:holo-[acyl-carrier-protein] synthase n=1 Tax=Erythroxylum novogranatense TaxID=1862640 RepID=A0AAV8UEW6_9ROSI|nr:hypothetical protein K2173_018592 [Erythroxylum novogranatense]